ncbi:ABC transporter permease [Acuticoccus sp. MNP-M23]|uniref:ABC transporter permease n=1 Tax=Acuticoccus sp. MNP-M23 TaxID=3072793 RepID=UPI0028165E21|nr:ABC transporter permease [Acuticoccus sp. MNP-M23]WMS43504.1 ABC transporter permease [Acuticoccus sp. MNP-M23]
MSGSPSLWRDFLRSPKAIISAVGALLLIGAAFLAPVLAPHSPFELGTFNLMDSELPPSFMEGGDPRFLLGTDMQGRDVFSAILFGMRISLTVGIAAVAISAGIGTLIGLFAGFYGGFLDSALMRLADVVLSFPTILIALLVAGIARSVAPQTAGGEGAILILIFAIAINEWTQYARTVRGQTMVEKGLDYVKAARVTGVAEGRILSRHILPNILSPVIVIATINLALAVLAEATLSFLGVGMPATSPSLGTLIRIGNENLFSGVWWVVVFPAVALVLLVLFVNLFGDWLRDALNPRID